MAKYERVGERGQPFGREVEMAVKVIEGTLRSLKGEERGGIRKAGDGGKPDGVAVGCDDVGRMVG